MKGFSQFSPSFHISRANAQNKKAEYAARMPDSAGKDEENYILLVLLKSTRDFKTVSSTMPTKTEPNSPKAIRPI